MSGREFARQNGLEAESVYRWGKEFPGAGANGKTKPQRAFTEVRVGGDDSELVPRLEVELKNDRVLRIPAGADTTYVRKLIEALESC